MRPDSLQLPRPLVNPLLRQAQRAAQLSQGWITRAADGRLHLLPLPADCDLTTLTRAPAEPAFRFYRSAKTGHAALIEAETAALARHTSLYLDMALDTKDVRQPRAWQIAGTRLRETGGTITDTPAGPQ